MTRTRKRRIICGVLAAFMLAGAFTGCGKKQTSSEQVKLTIGGWPKPETNKKKYEDYQTKLEKFKESHPDIEVETDEYGYNIEQFMARTASGMNPDLFSVPLTEPQKLISTGYIRDITKELSVRGFDNALNNQVKEAVSKDGKMYGVPYNTYMMGLLCNVEMFKQAGLVDENGVPKYPQTYKELAETAKVLKEKTGQAGFSIPANSTFGGWMLINIAWSNGVKFMEKGENGKWKATFNTPEMYETMQYISDLRWKYDVLPNAVLSGYTDVMKLFGVNQAAMIMHSDVDLETFTKEYKMNKDSISYTILPAGNKGRCAQLGGAAYLMSEGLSEKQVNAALDWLELLGVGAKMTDEVLAGKESELKSLADDGEIIVKPLLQTWTNKEYNDEINKIYDKYTNVDSKFWDADQSKVTLKQEEPASCQQLYEILTSVMQAVLTDKNANIPSLVEDAQTRFQKDYLDKLDV